MLPPETYTRLLKENEVLGLRMKASNVEIQTFYFRVDTVEGPNDLADYSLGAASAQNTAGTGWSEITDSQGRYHLEPELECVIYHGFFGVTPSQAWIYRRYPASRDLNSLLGTRSIGGAVGFIDGQKSPYRHPSPTSEFFSMKGQHPAFIGYSPFLEPSSITVRLYFYVTRYDVVFLGVDPTNTDKDLKRVIASELVRSRAHIRPVGGRELVNIPSWVESAMRI